MTDKERLTELLKNSIIHKEVTLSSGKGSSYYIDGKMVSLSAEGASLCAKVVFESIKDFQADAIGGLTLGADPLASVVAAYSFSQGRPLNAFIVRKAQKEHGQMKHIEGPLDKQDKVILIDDVITTGSSILEAAKVIRDIGCQIVLATALVDRQEGASEALEAKGIEYKPLFKISQLI
ncbi:MAG: orotate phosphoribosyltransferase [Actinobacteria bacterium]|nr:MAG: orotate phosphoribosyltransferase [Actinomycetota bacterium]